MYGSRGRRQEPGGPIASLPVLQLEEAVGEPASLIATVLSRRSEATAVASNQLLHAEFSASEVFCLEPYKSAIKEDWLLLLKWVITVARQPASWGTTPATARHRCRRRRSR